ncbi:MAG: site-2 protease family protein [Patescibacteria group bacterium]
MILFLVWILAFLITIAIHEFAHAWMADKLGDPTARIQGRLSLNPLVHYDPIGTTLLLVLVVLRALGAPVIPFGWAKPVRYDPFNLKDPRRDAALISFAGPLINLLVAGILSLLLRFAFIPFFPLSFLSGLFYPFIILNISLGVFNLIPVHPLDGGKIIVGLLPEAQAREADMFLSRYGTIILLFFIFPVFGGTSLISLIISPVINFLINLFIP